MTLMIHFLLGFISSFLGSLTPSMLNMSALKMKLESGEKAAIWFSVGISSVVLFQAYLGVVLSKYILENPRIIEGLEKAAVVIFIGLSMYFYVQSKNEKKKENGPSNSGKNSFFMGVFLSLLNLFSIPFYGVLATTLEMLGLLKFDTNTILFFVFGSALGTLGILMIYTKYSKMIQQKAGRFTKDMNLVLSFLTGIVAVFTLLKFFTQ